LAYLNGSLGGSPVTAAGSSINGFTIGGGGDYGFDPYPFTGVVDDLQIFTSVLTAAQISNIYSNTFTNSVSSWMDKSGNNNTAVNVNSSARITDMGVHLNGNGYFTVNGLVNSLVDSPFVLFMIETIESMSGQPALFGDNVTTGGVDGGLHLVYINENFFLEGFYADDLGYYDISGTGAMRLWTFYLPTSSNRTLRLNGSHVKTHNTANRLNAFQQPVIGRVFGAHNYTGTFSEIILYNVDLGVSSIEQIENYLLQKWKMKPRLPNVINPVPSPLQVRDCTLWLDGADASSLSLSGSAVQTWNDKSGHNYDATIGSNSSSVLKTTLGLSFDGSGFMTIPGIATLLANTPFVIFIVETARSTTNSFFFGDTADPGPAGGNLLLGYRYPTQMTFGMWYDDLENYNVAGTNSTRVWCFYLPTSSNRMIRRNGVLDSTHSNYNRLSRFVSPVIGRFSSSFYTGTISEIIVYASDPGLSAIQSIEAYLLNKWGRAGVNKLVPASIPGMALWLDGTDVAGTGYSAAEGSVLSLWADKSGNNAHGSAISGPPTYDALTQSVVFDGNSIFQFPNGTITPGSSTFTIFLVCKPKSLASYPYVYKAGSPGYDTCTALIFYPNGAIENGFYTDFMTIASAGSVREDQSYIFTSAFDGTTRTLYRNGSSVVSGTIAGTKNVASSDNYLGGGGNTVSFTGTMSEFIVFNRTLTSSERESVELYLTSKWKIPRGDLSHGPIASAPGCWLWLDGADPLGTDEAPESGTTITKWVDKSGNGRSATANSGPTFTSNAINGCSALVFSSTSLVTPSAELSPNNKISTFVVFSTNVNNRGGNNDFLYPSSVSYSTFDLSIDQATGLFLLFNENYASLLSNISDRPILLSIISDSTTVNVYRNGNFLCSIAVGSQTYPLNVVTGWNVGVNFSGCFAELLMFNTSLTTAQQQSIESYLAVKWGFASLPFTPTLSYPTLIPGCRMWLDGSDPSGDGTKFQNGETISSWVDKSGYGNNATPSSGRVAATFSTLSNCVYFQSSNVGYRTNYTATPTSETMFLVVNIKSPSSFTNNILIGGGINARSIGIGYNSLNYTSCSYLRNEVAWEQSTPSQSFLAGDVALVTGQVINSGTTLSIAINGAQFSTGSGFGAFGSPATTTYLGVDTSSTTFYYVGYVHEIIFYNSLLTLDQRQFVERYLTKKWGITKTFYEEIPGQIPGCQLWLDSKDTSTMYSDTQGTYFVAPGDSVYLWKDKSGHGRNYTPYYTPPIYEGGDGGSVTFYQGQSMINSDSWSGHGSGVDIFLVSTPWDYTQYYDWRTLFRGNSGGHRVILWHNAQMMGFYNNLNGYGFCQFGTLTQGHSKSLMYVRTEESFSSSAGLNGGPLKYAGGIQDYDTQPFYFLGGYGSYQNWGAINEVLIFSNVTSAQRETIEAYLANKWNLTTSKRTLPIEHPHSSLKPLGRVVTPVDIPTCQLWLDASDTRTILSESTIVNSTQNFTVWNDKSGNERNMSVIDGTVLYTDHSILCSGSGYLRVDSPVNLTSFTVFIVVTPNPNYQNQTVFSAIPYSGGEAYYSLDGFDFFLDGSTSSRFYAGGSAIGVNSTNNQPQTTGPKLFTYVTDGNSLSSWTNGMKLVGETILFQTTRSSGAQGFIIGTEVNQYQAKTCRSPIHELIVYNSVLSDRKRQQIEGYLSKKWKISLASSKVFTYTGSTQSWVCPQNLTSVTFHAWGAGGGCAQQGGVVGGAGAYVTGTLSVTPGNTYYIVVGCGGYKMDYLNYYATPFTYGGGGYGYYGGSGGGYSGIFTDPFPSQASALLVVGGGGGAGPDGGNDVGGSASWTSNAQSGGTNNGTPGGGATSSGGGSAGGGGTSSSGSALQGGNGGHYGGGGGGGYWGGGGGGSIVTGGGGGNSYWNSSYVSSVSGADALSQPNMTYLPGPGSSSPYYQAFAGSSYNWQNGGNGLLVLVECASTHPFVTIPPQIMLSLSPLNFNKCVLWIDASQVTSLNGLLLQNLAPQSSYGLVCTGTLNKKGKNKLNTILISRFQYMTTVPAPFLPAYTLFFVGRQTGGQNARVLNGYWNQLYGYWGGYKKAIYVSGNPGWLAGYYADTEWDLLSHSRTADGPYIMNWNGAALYSNSRYSTTNSLYGFTINAGDYNDTSGSGQGENSDCEIAEIILFDSVLTLLQVKQIEGYLAQKWGLELPALHPYKSIPPPRSVNPVLTYSDYLLTTVYSLAAQVPDRSGPYNAGGNNIGWGSIIQSATANRYIHYGNNNSVYINGYGNYSCFTSGYVYSLIDTVINLRVVSDDGIIVNFNGANVIDQFRAQGATQYDSGNLQISAGYTPIRITWYDTGGGGQYDFYYSYDQSNFTDDTLGRFFHLSTATY
jgi:hypothetical protein